MSGFIARPARAPCVRLEYTRSVTVELRRLEIHLRASAPFAAALRATAPGQ